MSIGSQSRAYGQSVTTAQTESVIQRATIVQKNRPLPEFTILTAGTSTVYLKGGG